MTRYLITILTVFLISACSANRELIPPKVVPVHVVKSDVQQSIYSLPKNHVCNELNKKALKPKEGEK